MTINFDSIDVFIHIAVNRNMTTNSDSSEVIIDTEGNLEYDNKYRFNRDRY